MADVQQILARYDLLRRQGLEARAALDILRDSITALNHADRMELARRVRTHESAPPIPTHSANAPEDGIICPNCGKRNRPSERLCYSCGTLLLKGTDTFQTQILDPDDPALADDAYFGADSVLILTARTTQQEYKIRPQDSDRELVVGRSTNRGPMMPDIDLADSDGNKLGVSRLHLSIRYDTQYNTITAFDLGSANGTFVNGQRLHPHEVRVLHHKDELRLGNMMLDVTFRHSAQVN
jgi:hypothetical protein